MTPEPVLKACPFCGREPHRPEFVCESGSKDIWEIGCRNCDYTIEGPRASAHEAESAAIAAWNTRASISEPVAPVSKVVERIMALIDERLCIVWYPRENRDTFVDLLADILASARTALDAAAGGVITAEMMDEMDELAFAPVKSWRDHTEAFTRTPEAVDVLVEALTKARERAETLIDLSEQGMLAERKAQYGSAFSKEQEVAIRQTHQQQLKGVRIMFDAALAQVKHHG